MKRIKAKQPSGGHGSVIRISANIEPKNGKCKTVTHEFENVSGNCYYAAPEFIAAALAKFRDMVNEDYREFDDNYGDYINPTINPPRISYVKLKELVKLDISG